jgi:hypothetical protein
MKLNVYQKIVLLIYGCLFVYFTILHVPFKSNYRGEIKYDTLFSNSSNLDTGRLILIIVILTILTVVLLLLLRNIKYSFRPISQKRKKIIAYSLLGVVILFAAIFAISKYKVKKNADTPPIVNTQAVDSVAVVADTTTSIDIPPFLQKKAETCNEEQALRDFKSHMKFYYPDWKIYGNPVVREQSDCAYRVQFTTLDPHIKYEREVIIVEISYAYDYTKYNFRIIRGTLY